MKRAATILILLFIFATESLGQDIQTNFLGLKIGEEYHFDTQTNIAGYPFEKEGENDFLGLNIRFGGYDWDFTWILLSPIKRKFHQIVFESYFNDEKSAREMTNRLHEQLSIKYGDKASDEEFLWHDKNDMFCSLNLSYEESKSGKLYWYVTLVYWSNIHAGTFEKYIQGLVEL